ncbi:hypothetical protein BIV23_06765 [Streptomyces monashensis]|uniref:Uncharacterized protein n=1 Tax=Streptomyces monashensis TaxID=1678012 RepID=A0A1S2QKW1_9ACTN|nr:hypothetical protein BIV23_06765 [Streptomyces monashensis]
MERADLDRLRERSDFPETLRERVQVVGTTEGAALMKIPVGRFTRLARLGLLVPVRWYVNRYRAVVWLYLADDLRHFTLCPENAHLLKGRTPETLRGQLEAGVDLRARNWRGRHLGFLLRQAEGPWARAGAVAAFLAPVEIADVVKDPYERSYVNRFRPTPPGHGLPGSAAAQLAERITTAQDADEIEWLRGELAHVLVEARNVTPAPRPATRRAAPSVRAAARPIPPLARTVTRHAESAAPTGMMIMGVPGRDEETAVGASQAASEPVAGPRSVDGASGVQTSEPQGEAGVGKPDPSAGPVPAAPDEQRKPAARAATPGGEQLAAVAEPDARPTPGESEGHDGPVFGAPWPEDGAAGRAFAWHHVPTVRQAGPPARRDRRPERAAAAPASRGLRGWLRHRGPRPERR